MRRISPMLAVLAVLLVGSALVALKAVSRAEAAGGAPAPPPALQITIDQFTFGPREVTVARGTRVTWLNRDDMPHTVVSSDKQFESGPLDTGDRFSHTFDETGTYRYFCSLHPRMTGTIVVR